MNWSYQLPQPFIAILSIAVVVVSGDLYWWTSDGPRIPHPSLELPRDRSITLGDGLPNDVLEGSFIIGNAGREPLEFSLSASCSCASLEPREGSIPYRGRQIIRYGVKLKDYGTTATVSIQLQCNDPKHPMTNFQVIAECPPPLSLTPNRLDFGNFAIGSQATREFEVAGRKGTTLPADAVVSVEPGTPHVRVTPLAQGRFRVVMLDTAPLGYFGTELRVTATGVAEAVSLPLTANVGRTLMAAPSTVRLSSKAEGMVVLVYRLDGQALPPITKVEGPDWLSVESLTEGTAKHQRLRLSRKTSGDSEAKPNKGEQPKQGEQAAKAGEQAAKVHVWFTGVTESVEISVRVE